MQSQGERRAPAWVRQMELSYVLIADADEARVQTSLQIVKNFKVAVLVARDGQQAVDFVRRFGAPMLLLVDLALPFKDGFSVIEAARTDGSRQPEIMVWSPDRHTPFVAERVARLKVTTVGRTITIEALSAAIEAALRRTAPHHPVAAAPRIRPATDLDQTLRGLAERAQALCGTSAAAVYVKVQGETLFRAFVTWSCDAAIPESPYYPPRVFDAVIQSGQPLVLPNIGAEHKPIVAGANDAIRGLVAVPVVTRTDSVDHVIGALCVFDVHPLTLDTRVVEALTALGRSVAMQSEAADRAEVRRADRTPAAPVAAMRRPSPVESRQSTLVLVHDRSDGELAIRRELARVRREHRPLSMVLFGIDAVDQPDESAALASHTQLAQTLFRALRESDLVIDWARNELLAVLPGVTASEARQVAERVRAAIQVGARFQAAVSAGVEELQGQAPLESVVERARDKVRAARGHGHNRVA
jgi:DNA-binding response OmpR family regulator/GGDEF domain-containing protein